MLSLGLKLSLSHRVGVLRYATAEGMSRAPSRATGPRWPQGLHPPGSGFLCFPLACYQAEPHPAFTFKLSAWGSPDDDS